MKIFDMLAPKRLHCDKCNKKVKFEIKRKLVGLVGLNWKYYAVCKKCGSLLPDYNFKRK